MKDSLQNRLTCTAAYFLLFPSRSCNDYWHDHLTNHFSPPELSSVVTSTSCPYHNLFISAAAAQSCIDKTAWLPCFAALAGFVGIVGWVSQRIIKSYSARSAALCGHHLGLNEL